MVLVPVLIETLWNVNLASAYWSRAFCVVLIETLWNVNLESNSALLFRQIVLIETLWNVNIVEILQDQALTHRINRNIVECKYRIYSLH